jgi:hypothetical protein
MKHIVGYFFTLVLLAGCNFTGAQKLAESIDTQFTGIKSIQVEGVFCDVTVEQGQSDEVHLMGEIRSTRNSDKYSIETSQNGTQLKLWVEHPNIMFGNVKGFLAFEIPDDVTLNVENVSGNVTVSNIGSDELRLTTVSGNIKASVTNGALSVKSVSGNQQIANIKGNLSTKSISGNVTVKMVEGESEISTTSGNLILDNLMSYASVNTTSGDIHLNVLRGDLSANSVSGDLTLTDVTGALDLKTTSGDQKGTKIMLTGSSRFSSVSGDITMDLENPVEALGFDLRSGSGALSAGGSRSDERLVIERGDIQVKGLSSSGDQTFR